MREWLLIPLAYLVGSVSSAIIVCRLLNLPDPRQQGSKNPGATNVLRLGGKKAAAITLLGDMLKGYLPVVLANALNVGPLPLALVGLAAFLGHLYPLFFEFKGGKGVATALGALAGFSLLLGLAILLTWLAVAAVSRISSLAALTAAALAPLYGWWLLKESALTMTIFVMSGLLIWRHRGNIARLLAGEESRIGH